MVKAHWSTGILSVTVVMVLSCSEASQDAGIKNQAEGIGGPKDIGALAVPGDLKTGEDKFNSYCSRCHGVQGIGTNNGPPLVHKIYEPNHHGDFAFQRAAAQGVRAHHWKFGDMPKIEDVTPGDVNEIIPYIRWLQRRAGIY